MITPLVLAAASLLVNKWSDTRQCAGWEDRIDQFVIHADGAHELVKVLPLTDAELPGGSLAAARAMLIKADRAPVHATPGGEGRPRTTYLGYNLVARQGGGTDPQFSIFYLRAVARTPSGDLTVADNEAPEMAELVAWLDSYCPWD